MYAREGTSDLSIINSTFINDEYDLGGLDELEGWALDIGAHIGSITIPLALDHPALHVIAVEAVPANCDVLWDNIVANELQDRVHLFRVALSDHFGNTSVWSEYKHAPGLDDDYVRTNRFIGNIVRGENLQDARVDHVRALRLSDILSEIADVAFMKTDCEGCEWAAFADPAIAKVRYIIGEYHDRTENDLAEALYPTHEVTTYPAAPENDIDGGIGMFRAERRD